MPVKTPRNLYPILTLGLCSAALSGILVRFVDDQMTGLAIAFWRSMIAVAILLPFAVPKILPELRQISRQNWGKILLSGIFFGAHFSAWIQSLYFMSVASSTVLVNTSPIFLAIGGYMFFKEQY